MSDSADFTKLVPGFEFLQNLVKNAGVAMPSVGQWVAPTLDPEEIDKRIGELRTVQFWLEQNARMIGTTIQALEVQRMTLSTLTNMNVQMSDLRDALTIRMPEAAPAAAAEPAARREPAAPRKATAKAPAPAPAPASAAAPAPAGAVDPMQWWGALTRQFTELAANAMRETADAARASGVPMPPGAPAASSAPAAPPAPAKRPSAKRATTPRRSSGAR